MIKVAIPGRGNYKFEHLLLDLNGTIALDGEIIKGVEDRLRQLSSLLNISIVTADTHGSARWLEQELKLDISRIAPGEEGTQKLSLVQQLGKQSTICVGNGSNDAPMLEESALGICVSGGEGLSVEAIMHADLVVSNINDALDLLLNPDRLIATLRK